MGQGQCQSGSPGQGRALIYGCGAGWSLLLPSRPPRSQRQFWGKSRGLGPGVASIPGPPKSPGGGQLAGSDCGALPGHLQPALTWPGRPGRGTSGLPEGSQHPSRPVPTRALCSDAQEFGAGSACGAQACFPHAAGAGARPREGTAATCSSVGPADEGRGRQGLVSTPWWPPAGPCLPREWAVAQGRAACALGLAGNKPQPGRR